MIYCGDLGGELLGLSGLMRQGQLHDERRRERRKERVKEGGVRRKRGERAAAVSYEITGGATIAALQGGRLAVGEGEKGRDGKGGEAREGGKGHTAKC